MGIVSNLAPRWQFMESFVSHVVFLGNAHQVRFIIMYFRLASPSVKTLEMLSCPLTMNTYTNNILSHQHTEKEQNVSRLSS